jgi:hypothetical protein
MEKGIIFAKFLEIFYRRKLKNKQTVVSPFWIPLIAKRTGCSREEAEIVWRAAARYTEEYKDENWEPLAIEAGFTVPFYADNEIEIYLEGRPDLVVKANEKIMVVDHKTQSSHYDLQFMAHQPMAYLYAISNLIEQETYQFCYNYILFSKSPSFRRSIGEISKNQILMWKNEVLKLLVPILKSGDYFRTFNCRGIFGLCDFYKVCISPSEKYQDWYLNNIFKRREQRKKSWEYSIWKKQLLQKS